MEITKIKIITALAAVAMSINVKGIYGESLETDYNNYLESLEDNYEGIVSSEQLNINDNSPRYEILDMSKEKCESDFVNIKLSEHNPNTVNSEFTIKNTSLEALDLSMVKFNYYYANENEDLQEFKCCYAGTIDGDYKLLTYNVNGKIIKLDEKYGCADSCIEITFDDGILDIGQSMIIQILINKNIDLNDESTEDYSFDNLPNIEKEYISEENIENNSLDKVANKIEETSIGRATIPEVTVKKGDTVTIPLNFEFTQIPYDKVDIVNAIIKFDSSILENVKVTMGDELEYDPLYEYEDNKNYGIFPREELMAFDQIVESNTGKKGDESGCMYIQLRSEYNKDIYENIAKTKNQAFITFTVSKDAEVNEAYLIPFDVKYMTEGIKYGERYYKQYKFDTHFGKIVIKDSESNYLDDEFNIENQYKDVTTENKKDYELYSESYMKKRYGILEAYGVLKDEIEKEHIIENTVESEEDSLIKSLYSMAEENEIRKNPSLSNAGITYFEVPIKDIEINLNLEDTFFKGIKGLTEGIEYELNTERNIVAIKPLYLASIKSNKETKLEFEFGNGHIETFTIQIKSYISNSRVSIQSKPLQVKKGQIVTVPIYTKVNYLSESENQNITKETNRAIYTLKYDPEAFEDIKINETNLAEYIGGEFWNIVDEEESEIIIGYSNTDKDIITAFKYLPIASISFQIKPDCEEGEYNFQLINSIVKAGEDRYLVWDDLGEVWVEE